MKHLNLVTLLAFGFALPFAAHASFSVTSEPVQLSVTSVHVPAGFSDGTAQAVTVEIPLRDSCYHYDKIERQDLSPTEHQFKIFGHVDRQGMCMMVFRFMQHDIILSNLAPGNHDLIFENADGSVLKQQITVNRK